MRTSLKFLYLIFFLQLGASSFAQVTPQPPPADTLREFEILRGPSMRSIHIDSVTTLQTIAGGAIVKQGSTIFHGDSLVINPVTRVIEAFGNIEINQADTSHTYSQYLKYLGNEKMAYLKKNVKLTDKKGTLLTQDLDYNLETGIGNFYNGGKVIEGKSVITSVDGTYYADTKDIYFKKNVKLDDPKNHLRADSLLYNMLTKQSTFISKTNIKNAEVDINTTQGTYDLTTGNALFTSRTSVKDSSGRIYTANNMALENKSGNAQLEGDAVIIDSANGFIVSGNQIFLNKKNNSFLATRKPVLIIKQKNDSTYIAADTIFSGFTTSVNRQEIQLKKDSVINVNVGENKKVEDIQANDSLYQDFSSHPGLRRDSSKIDSAEVDSLKLHSDTIHIKKNAGEVNGPPPLPDHGVKSPPSKDDRRKRNLKPVDSSHVSVPEKPLEKIAQEKATPQIDSLKSRTDTIPHISQNVEIGDSAMHVRSDSSTLDSMHSKGLHMSDSVHFAKSITKDSVNKSDSAVRYFLAFHHVRVFNDSLQSISDSLFLSTKDSVIRLYYDPIIWSGHSQITGDTIYLFTKNKQPERLYVFENGMIINKTREGFYNQMAGKTINGYFIDGKIDYMRVRGSQAESIYYIQNEDSAYIGMNRATGDVIDLYFKNEDINKVLFVNDIKGNMYPMKQIPEDQKQLKSFKWLDERRPKNKLELFE
jgi:OstA-like protein